ncbi:hypothetical protein [Polaribacter porphyrae]|uniref:Uncharacterized protein n=1 Tax=Polaribacter porphyrae TaxID=1137780 RepID=A0A2S7WPT7_9FLAO|nr:hypothetical protein [Polaribacter porphyrae]PQJ79617.1 hypothetical protein BTO18_10730 [Polaribacter porphyrae]
MVNNWKIFDDANTINSLGSENGIIIIDEENIFGARITIERNTDIAPFSVTFSIYNLMFHTEYFNRLSEATSKVKIYKVRIEEILSHLKILDKKREKNWREKYNFMLEKLVE